MARARGQRCLNNSRQALSQAKFAMSALTQDAFKIDSMWVSGVLGLDRIEVTYGCGFLCVASGTRPGSRSEAVPAVTPRQAATI
jgi:hypothetical protein